MNGHRFTYDRVRLRARARRARRAAEIPAEHRPMLELWILRAVVTAGGWQDLHRENSYMFNQVLALGGIPETDGKDRSVRRAVRRLNAHLQEREQAVPRRRGALFDNLAALGCMLGFSRVEQDLLALADMADSDSRLETCIQSFGWWSVPRLARFLSVVLGHPRARVSAALSSDSALARTGLLVVRLERNPPFELLDGLDGILLSEHRDERALLGCFFSPVRGGRLSLGDYPHLAQHVGLLTVFLDRALAGETRGVNVLLHGAPGTGKTEFARALARSLEVEAYEVSGSDSDGEAANRRERFAAFQLCQRFLERRRGRALVLFDEVEDVFPAAHDLAAVLAERQGGLGKFWTNRLLEDNPVPAIWITNRAGAMDPAYLRRFDYVLGFEAPPRSVRARIVSESLQGLGLPEGLLRRITDSEAVTPGDVAKLGRVLPAGDATSAGQAAAFLEERLRVRELRLEGQALSGPGRYDISLVNADSDLGAVVSGLAAGRQGRVCLYGPPGTGKTAFARHLAEQMDAPLVLRRASDLLSCWLGQTEQLIAEMFRAARADRAVLLLDEADSFLADRRGAVRSWEVTQVNELLTQMESFEGVFVCATNLMDRLDQAVFRRFDLKIKLSYLRAEQAWRMFARLAGELGVLPADEQERAALRRELGTLTRLTPGDFAVAARQAAVCGAPRDAAELVQRLRHECRVKTDGGGGKVGFVG